MNAHDEDRIKQLLKQALPPVDPRRNPLATCGPPCSAASTLTPPPRRPPAPPELVRLGASRRPHRLRRIVSGYDPCLSLLPVNDEPKLRAERCISQHRKELHHEPASLPSRVSRRRLCTHPRPAVDAHGIHRSAPRSPGAVPIERGLIFPMALVPAGFGLWNMLWLGSHGARICPSACTAPSLPFSSAAHGSLRRPLSRCPALWERRRHMV